MAEATRYGVPLSVAHRLMVEESGDPITGEYGDALRVSTATPEGYRGLGLYQLFSRPDNMAHLVRKYWTPYHRGKTFDVFNPLQNAEVAIRYLADLHRRFGSWERALWYYNCGRVTGVGERTRGYARRIVEAREPTMPDAPKEAHADQ